MNIEIRAIGKMKLSAGFQEMEQFYKKRISHFEKISIFEGKEAHTIEKETEILTKNLKTNIFKIALREEGKKFNSIEFSKLLLKQKNASKNLVFFIGGAYGLGEIKEDISISIAPWTLPHQLARIVLLEQIYRGLSIINHKNYHHA